MYSRQQLKETAKRNIEGKIWKLFLCSIIAALLALVANIPFLGPVAVIVLMPAFYYGFMFIYLKVTANEEFSPADLFFVFEKGSFIWKVLGTYYLTALYTILWSLLFIIPGIVKSYSYSMAPMIIIENPEMSVRDAINESKKMMSYHKADLFILQLSFIGWSLLCSITFGIASIYVIPYYTATFINFYRYLKQTNNPTFGAQSDAYDQPKGNTEYDQPKESDENVNDPYSSAQEPEDFWEDAAEDTANDSSVPENDDEN